MLMDFGGVKIDVVTRQEFTLDKARETLEDEVNAVLGYGVQGRAQSLNMRDNGAKVIVGVQERYAQPGEKQTGWERALEDNWTPGVDLFSDIREAAAKGTIVQFLLHDAGQKKEWPSIKPYMTEGKALCFSHGFSIVYSDQTGVIPPANIDIILVAPKGSGKSVRENFENGSGINSSYAVHQDYTGNALNRTLAVGMLLGSGYMFPTTSKNEVHSDLTGERGVLMGALYGIMKAQYELFRGKGHDPSEAFNETVEELTQSLIRIVAEGGMDHMYKNCSATAQRGALDWAPRFEAAVKPVFEELYERVVDGSEVRRVLEATGSPDYTATLGAELKAMRESEMWQAGAAVRSLRPENWQKK